MSLAPSPALAAAASRPGRVYRKELDVVRFFAFLMVFLQHSLPRGRAGEAPGPFMAHFGPVAWHLLIAFGNTCGMGLSLFFTLSAYLITDLLLREYKGTGTVSIKDFYIRRVLRIWPLYYVGLLLALAYELFATHHHPQLRPFPWFIFFAANIYGLLFPFPANPMYPLWSISIEEQFYLILPWVIRFASRRGAVICAIVFLVVANICLFLLGRQHANTDTTVWFNTLVQFQMFAVGILLALNRQPLGQKAKRFTTLGTALILAGPVLWFSAVYVCHAKQPAAVSLAIGAGPLVLGYALIALGCAAVLQGFLLLGPAPFPQWAADLGKVSFGLYVFHELMLYIASYVFRHPGFQVLALGMDIVVAKLSYNYLERPFLQLKRRFEYVHARPV